MMTLIINHLKDSYFKLRLSTRNPVFIKTFEGVIFLTALKRFLTIFDNLYFQGGQLLDHPGQIPDHPGQVPDLPTFEVVRFLSTLPRFLTTLRHFL